jgi:hypothetical protein
MVRVQADSLPRLRQWLQDQTAAADVRADLPDKWIPGNRPVITIADDGGPMQWPIKSRHTIRITGWGDDRVAVRRMVAVAVGELHGAQLPGLVVSKSSGAVIEGRDSATGGRFASALMTINARTVEV